MGSGLTTFEWIQIFATVLFGLGSVLGPFVLKWVRGEVEAARELAREAKTIALDFAKQLNDYKLYSATNHVTSARIEQLERALFEKLDKIDEKLDARLNAINHRIDGKQDRQFAP